MPREGSQIFGPPNASQTSAGTSQTTATTAAGDDVYLASVSSGTGIVLQGGNPGDIIWVTNGDTTNALLVYPPSGAAFNGSSANAAVTVPAAHSAMFKFITNNIIGALF